MSLSAIFIRRPVATTLIMLSILLFGIIGYRLLPVSDLPNVDYPVISVSANLPGANPDTMAAAVATPLEKQFSTIAGIESMSSTSTQGSTQITLQFTLSRSIDAAAGDVNAAIARALRQLPADMTTPPSYRKVNPADQPIIWLALASAELPMSVVDELGQTTMAQRISMVDGVAQVQVFGSQKYAVRVQLDPRAMNARGIGLSDVKTAIGQQNVNLPLGSFDGADKTTSVQDNGQIVEAQNWRPLIVSYRNGHVVRLSDIGQVVDSVENNRVAAWLCTPQAVTRSVILAVQRQPGTNTVKVAHDVLALLPTFRAQLPAGITMTLLRDGSIPIKESSHDVQFTLILTLGLVIMVIFIFLRNLSATVIPSLTLPLAIVGTFAAMYFLDYSLDNLSLMALTLAVGFVVDDAIVMLENIVRHMEMGKSPMQAALDGAREIGFTIISMTISLAAVFIPVLFMGGIIGRLFREFAVTIGVAVLISGFISLSLTPMLGSLFLRDPSHMKHNFLYRFTEAIFDGILRVYSWTLLKALRYHWIIIIISAAVLYGTYHLFMVVPKGFVPAEDRDFFMVQTLAAEDTSFEAMRRHQMEAVEIIRQVPEIQCFMCAIGAGGPSGASNAGRMFITLKPRRERTRSADQVIQALRPQLAQIPGLICFLANPPPINTSAGRNSRSLYQVTLQGSNTAELFSYSNEFLSQVRALPQCRDVDTDLLLRNPQLRVTIDRDQAAVLGLTPAQIEDALYNAYGTRQVSTILAPSNQYQVIMELQPQYLRDPQLLSMLYVRSSTGNLVPLSAVTKSTESIAPLAINHTGQLTSVTISFNLNPGFSLGQAVDAINAAARQTKPATITMAFQGSAQVFKDSVSTMGGLLLLAIIVIYIVLGILYESFIHPLTILTALPFAGFGALLTLWLFHEELSIYAFVGIIMLIGLVKKNGIMMVDFAINAQRLEGKNAHDAIHEACVIRFRPIMMTTMCALIASIPIALGYGAGGESRRPLGLAVVGGLIFSQTLTLYVTPVFYLYMEHVQQWLRPRAKVATGAETSPGAHDQIGGALPAPSGTLAAP